MFWDLEMLLLLDLRKYPVSLGLTEYIINFNGAFLQTVQTLLAMNLFFRNRTLVQIVSHALGPRHQAELYLVEVVLDSANAIKKHVCA